MDYAVLDAGFVLGVSSMERGGRWFYLGLFRGVWPK